MLKIFVGFDAAIEPIAYHTFCQSVIEKASIPVSFTPLALNTLNGYKYPTKYLGFKNEDYPRKNWSSVMVWNCDQFKNKQLTPEYIMKASGKELHRFEWLDNQFINLVGEIPKEWNWLVSEYGYNPDAKLVHFTLGTPCFTGYKNCDYANEWWETYHSMIYPLKGNGQESEL
jgi:hypothetical protein